jgi:hypothetical protein
MTIMQNERTLVGKGFLLQIISNSCHDLLQKFVKLGGVLIINDWMRIESLVLRSLGKDDILMQGNHNER